MILGIGIDIVQIERLKTMNLEKLAGKIFSKGEQNEFFKIKNLRRKYEFFAGRFCSKEAFFKSTGKGIRNFPLSKVEVFNDAFGKPELSISPELIDFYFSVNVRLHLSISHERDFAVATVIVEETRDYDK